jgi:hypothetical protein
MTKYVWHGSKPKWHLRQVAEDYSCWTQVWTYGPFKLTCTTDLDPTKHTDQKEHVEATCSVLDIDRISLSAKAMTDLKTAKMVIEELCTLFK